MYADDLIFFLLKSDNFYRALLYKFPDMSYENVASN